MHMSEVFWRCVGGAELKSAWLFTKAVQRTFLCILFSPRLRGTQIVSTTVGCDDGLDITSNIVLDFSGVAGHEWPDMSRHIVEHEYYF